MLGLEIANPHHLRQDPWGQSHTGNAQYSLCHMHMNTIRIQSPRARCWRLWPEVLETVLSNYQRIIFTAYILPSCTIVPSTDSHGQEFRAKCYALLPAGRMPFY